MKMKIDIETSVHAPRFKGYSKIPNQDFLLLGGGLLNESEFVMHTISKSITTDWDANHFKTYTTFEKQDLIEQMSICSWTENKSNRIFRRLVKKGLFECIDKKRNRYINVSFPIQQYEVLKSTKYKVHPDEPFYYLEEVVKKVSDQGYKIDLIYKQKVEQTIANLKQKKLDDTVNKAMEDSIM